MTPPFGQRKPVDPPAPQPPVPESAPALPTVPPEPSQSAIEAKLTPIIPPVVPTTYSSADTAERDLIRDDILVAIDPGQAVNLTHVALLQRVESAIAEVATEHKLLLNELEQRKLAREMVDDMIGLGPLEPLLHDETISDILVNGPRQVYIERRGKLELTNVRFRSRAHVLHVIQRIGSKVRRSINEASPMLDARLDDGSRVNAIIWPLTLKGPNLSIRKFSKRFFGLDEFVAKGSASPSLAKALKIAAHCRLNIMISGGTGSGKTTLLNAMSQSIDHSERVITIEDAAELQLQQPHVVQLETRPANLEGRGQVAQRDLVRNALRMRPDRIILGEVRGAEAFDMLQAMNTGHNGSMSTVHANSPRDALARIENLVLMANLDLPSHAIRGQIASAFDLIIQIERMRDGVRRITNVAEIVGMEGAEITTQPLFAYHFINENPDGSLNGKYEATGLTPAFMSRIGYYGLGTAFLEAISDTRVAR